MAKPKRVTVASTGTSLMIRGAVSITSRSGEPSPALIEFDDGTVLVINEHGRIAITKQGKAEVAIVAGGQHDLAVITGRLRSLASRHGGNVQAVGL
jgi:hypothetical protein